MKKNYLVVFTLIMFGSFALEGQKTLPLNPDTKLIEYSELVLVDSTLNQSELYLKSKIWFAESFKSANDVIQLDDKDAGIIIGKGSFSIRGGSVSFTLKIQLKDSRYKYWISNFSHESSVRGYSGGSLDNEKPACGFLYMAKREWIENIPELTDQNIKLVIQDLKESLSSSASKMGEDNW